MTVYSLYHDEDMVYPKGGAPYRPESAYPEYPFTFVNWKPADYDRVVGHWLKFSCDGGER